MSHNNLNHHVYLPPYIRSEVKRATNQEVVDSIDAIIEQQKQLYRNINLHTLVLPNGEVAYCTR